MWREGRLPGGAVARCRTSRGSVGDLLNYRSGDSDREERSGGSMGRKRNRGRIQAHDGSIAVCGQDGDSQGSTRARYSLPDLPEEILHHVHSLVPMRDAAWAACVSHAFLRSWRCHPNLTFTKETMCSKENLRKWTWDSNDERYRREFNNNIDHILANHRAAGVKTFMLDFHGPYNTKSYNRLNSWLRIAITPVLEELTLSVLLEQAQYNFPCSHLSDSSGSTIRRLHLANCALGPTVNLSLRCLTELYLCQVSVTGDELWRLLSNSSALEILILKYCDDIICLEIPCQLQRFSCLEVFECSRLQLIENKAPNISSFEFTGGEIELSLGESLQVKTLRLIRRCVISYAIDKLASSVPNLETLFFRENAKTLRFLSLHRRSLGNKPQKRQITLFGKLLSARPRAGSGGGAGVGGAVIALPSSSDSCELANGKNLTRGGAHGFPTLILCSSREIVDAPMVPSKFLHLKVLSIYIENWSLGREYDFLSLVSFLDTAPSLEAFGLCLSVQSKYDLIVGDPSALRQTPERHHDKLKLVKITRFCPQKSLVELTRHILESATSLKRLILDTTYINYRCYGDIRAKKCSPLDRPNIREAHEAILAVQTYIEEKVPSSVKLSVMGPCSRCHAL